MKPNIFKPSTMMTFGTVQKDSQLLSQLFRDGHAKEIYLDLSQVTLCDSAGLALLIEAKRLSKQYGKILAVGPIPKAISSLAEFCGVEKMLTNDELV